jgi:hypothetical protein
MKRPMKISRLLGMILILGFLACKNAGELPSQMTPTPSIGITSQPISLATPYAQQPAAGICASPTGEIVKVTLNPDLPDPRCIKVSADQKLSVLNQTQYRLNICIGRFTTSLESGQETIFDTPFGDYLEPGVHLLQVSPCCGAELWLEVK